MNKYKRGAVLATLSLLLLACGREEPEQAMTPAAQATSAPGAETGQPAFAQLRSHIIRLASDEFEGRAPASRGEELTVAYIRQQFQAAGIRPGNGDSYFQEVPLVSIAADPEVSMKLSLNGQARELQYGQDMMVWTKRVVEQSAVNDSEMVFVGYGIVAPEYGWNDYAGLDVAGKTVVMLVNDPGYATQDPELFNGNAMTYYGRWTYKYEEAARQGAAGAIVVHETGAAGYGWDVVSGSWAGEQFDLVAEDNNMSRAAIEGWITQEQAQQLFNDAGLDFDALKTAAHKPGSQPVPLPARMAVEVNNKLRKSVSRNVIGLLPGTDRADEYFVYMAHWDHLGKDENLEGDQIYNGAVDNATGVAGLIELAREFASGEANRRSILFLAVAAEESGLLGSKYYGTHPPVPLNKTVAAINMDGLNVIKGPVRDVVVVGYGSSELEQYLEAAAEQQDRYLARESTPEKGYFYRSDHFNLAKVGVPVLYAESGVDSIAHGRDWGLAQDADYVENRYHKPADEYSEDWDLSGAVLDLQLYYQVGKRILNEDSFPNWYEGTEFRAIRDASLRQPN